MAIETSRYTFTVDDYHRMAETSILKEGARVELIEGAIVNMSPLGSKHIACVVRLDRHFWRSSPEDTIVCVQSSLQLSNTTEVLPDVMILNYREDAYGEKIATPDDVLLVVEVADSSLSFDRRIKLPMYANAGIPEAWIVDESNSRVEVYTQPVGDHFAAIQIYHRGEVVESPTIDWLSMAVEAIVG